MKYPDVKVRLSGTDGNALMIVGRVQDALRRADVPPDEIEAFGDEALSDDYDHILVTCFKWVDVS